MSLSIDARHAARSLRRRPLLTFAAVLSLALGIGVNTAVFSVFEQLVLRRLPVPAPDGIVVLSSPGPRPGGTSTGDSGDRSETFSYPLFRDLEKLQTPGLSPIVGHRDFAANVAYRGRSMRVEGLLVSGDYFSVLGLSPSNGRLLTRDDDGSLGARPVVVLGHDYWTTRFAADPSIVGQSIVVNGDALTVVGVAPRGFDGTTTLDRPQIFVPLAMLERVRAGSVMRSDHWLYLFARVQRGASRQQVQNAINGPFAALIRDVEFPLVRDGLDDRNRELFLARRLFLQDGAHGRQARRDETRAILFLLLGVTGFVLFIACANVAYLLLAKASDRESELVVRLALGASHRQLLRLLLLEATMIGLAGAVGALGVGRVTLTLIIGMLPSSDASLFGFDLNPTVLAFAILAGVGTSFVFGLFPAMQAVRAGKRAVAMRSGDASASRTTARFRTSLATAQIALATALLGQAALFTTSLANVAREDIGLRADGLATFTLSPYLNGYGMERARALFDRVEQELRAEPGVTGVTASTMPLLADNAWHQNVTVEGVDSRSKTNTPVSTTRIGSDFFHTLGIPMIAGREFGPYDDAGAPRVAIVNESFARQFNLGTAAVGHRMGLGRGAEIELNIEIIGLVRDAKYSTVHEVAPAQLYLPYRQGAFGPLTFYVRTSTDVRALMAAAPRVVAHIDPNLPLEHLRTMDAQLWDNTTKDRVLATLSSSFAVLATILAALGLYAVLTFTVSRRSKEIGIRMALGATAGAVMRMVIVQVTRMTIVGAVIGVAGTAVLGRLAQAMLFGVSGTSPVLMCAAAALTGLVAFAAAALPARRAARVAPGVALRLD